MKTFLNSVVFGLVGLLGATSVANAVPTPPQDINTYVLFAYDSLSFKGDDESTHTRGVITGGNVGVNNPDPNPNDTDYSASFGGHAFFMPTDGTALVADTIGSSDPLVSVFDVFTNDLTPSFSGTIRGTGPTPFSAPIIDPALLPTIPSFTIGTTDVTIQKNDVGSIVAGDYGAIEVQDGATLTLGPGVYNIKSFHTGKNVTINTSPGTIINVDEDLNIGNSSFVGGAGTAYFNVLGNNVKSNDLTVNLGKESTIYGFFFAPDGILSLGHGNDLYGHFWAKDIGSDFNTNVTWVPEPSTMLLMGSGLLIVSRRKRRTTAANCNCQ